MHQECVAGLLCRDTEYYYKINLWLTFPIVTRIYLCKNRNFVKSWFIHILHTFLYRNVLVEIEDRLESKSHKIWQLILASLCQCSGHSYFFSSLRGHLHTFFFAPFSGPTYTILEKINVSKNNCQFHLFQSKDRTQNFILQYLCYRGINHDIKWNLLSWLGK